MWGITARSALAAVGTYFVALVAEKQLAVMLNIANGAPNSETSPIPGAMQAVHANFYLLALIGIVIAFLARAHVESKLGGS